MTSTKKSDSEGEDKPKPIIIRNTTDLQRLKLEKLMQNPDKPVIIPERPKERGMPPVPDFVRNVMGSSAGAGSGEFHVYRHLRRKEYARQKYLKESAEKERLQMEYQKKLEENKIKAEERTAKKRAKRLKKKQKLRQKKKLKSNKTSSDTGSESSEESESENEHEETENDGNSEGKSESCLSADKEDAAEKGENSTAEVLQKDERAGQNNAVSEEKIGSDVVNKNEIKD